ncbi:uncharacterized protein LOC124254294 [Haliotis rubra]|uniref:uncharacterized protein LOC124254294 n=1 Tax=Haliotis rubra TaxID=36100 RepID=UPI001EE537C5|nr:uncharacterized protein LOC124254294 [Haliotis rubra]
MASTSTRTDLPKKLSTQNIAFFHFSEVIEMKSKCGLYKGTEVILKSKPNTLTAVRMRMDVGEIKPGFHMATYAVIKDDGVVKLQNHSKVLSCRPFAYDGVVKAFLNPQVKTAKEALATPLGVKITVLGTSVGSI